MLVLSWMYWAFVLTHGAVTGRGDRAVCGRQPDEHTDEVRTFSLRGEGRSRRRCKRIRRRTTSTGAFRRRLRCGAIALMLLGHEAVMIVTAAPAMHSADVFAAADHTGSEATMATDVEIGVNDSYADMFRTAYDGVAEVGPLLVILPAPEALRA